MRPPKESIIKFIIEPLNPFHVTGLFLYPLKTSENPWFSNVLKYIPSPACENKNSKSSSTTSFKKLSMYHFHTSSPGGNGKTSKHSRISLEVLTLETDFINADYDPIDYGTSLSTVTYL